MNSFIAEPRMSRAKAALADLNSAAVRNRKGGALRQVAARGSKRRQIKSLNEPL
jgi:hypothetical protein